MPALSRGGLTTGSLLSASCGTAIASVCAVGLFEIERLLGGVWSVAAVLTAGVCCFGLARACGRLTEVVPSGAGPLAFAARGLGRRTGLILVLPYLLLTLFLAGAEALIVGVLFSRVVPVPPGIGAVLFLVGTWGLCRAGVRVSYRVQALATWALVAGLCVVSILALADAMGRGELTERLLPPPPDAARFAAGVGQALFLFMGFELITSQAEIAAGPACVRWALGGSVVVLAGFYATVSLGFSCLDVTPDASGEMVPQLAVAGQAGGLAALLLVAVLSLLASFTSFNGALLALSRLTAALASQGILPRSLSRVEPRSLAPRPALALLLVLALGATALVGLGGAMRPAILAAAVSAAVVYAVLVWVRERSPFLEVDRGIVRRLASTLLAGCFVVLATGVFLDAGPALAGTLALLGTAFGAAILAAFRSRRRTSLPTRPAELQEEVVRVR